MTTDTIGVVFLSSVVLVLVVSAGRSGPQAGGEELAGVGRFASGAPTMPVSSEPTDTPVVDAAWIRREARELQRVMTHKSGNAFQQSAEPVALLDAHGAEPHHVYAVRPVWVVHPVIPVYPAIVQRQPQQEVKKEEEKEAPKDPLAPPPPQPSRPDYDINHATASVEIAKVAACMGASFSPAAQALR